MGDFMSILPLLKRILIYHRPSVTKTGYIPQEDKHISYDVRRERIIQTPQISCDIQFNMFYMTKRFDYPKNNDVVLRKIKLKGDIRGFLMFYDGMSDTNSVNNGIIKPLLELPLFQDEPEQRIEKIPSLIVEKFVSHSQAAVSDNFEEIIEEINFGSCGLFIDGLDKGFILDVRSWGHRGIDKPGNEQSIYGPQEAFSEMLRNNSALVRKILKTEKMICESVKIGKVSKTRGVMMYISDLANEQLVEEVRRRLNGISMDYCISSEEVAMFLEENSFSLTNQILMTERPDRVARALSEGRVAFLLNGNPHVLIMPTNAFELLHAASDDYLRVPYANFIIVIRLIAVIISVLLPALYLAITLYHREMIPTFLAYAISASRETVPFPSMVELLLMDISFEMIREAGIKMPNPIGSTLGIVGGLILGQAAVSAKIVSPIMIIVIALTGLGSFATPEYSLGWGYRILRIAFIILASILGFYGIAIGIFFYAVSLGARSSFGIPFLEPLFQKKKSERENAIFTAPVWKREYRPDYLETQKEMQQPKISMKWRKKRKK